MSAPADASPAEPPAWAVELANAAAKDKGGVASMQAEWKRSRDQMQRAATEDEQVMRV